MVDRFSCPKYTIKESNLPEIDVLIKTQPEQFTGWNQLVMTPPNHHLNQHNPLKHWNLLDRKLPVNVHNSIGVIHYQTPLELWPSNCGSRY